MTSETIALPPAPPVREERPLFAIGLRLAAMLSIGIMFAAIKVLNARGVYLVVREECGFVDVPAAA